MISVLNITILVEHGSRRLYFILTSLLIVLACLFTASAGLFIEFQIKKQQHVLKNTHELNKQALALSIVSPSRLRYKMYKM